LDTETLDALRRELVDRLGESIGLPLRDDDARARVPEMTDEAAADSRAASGDDDDAPGDSRVGHRHLRSNVPLTGSAAGPPVTSAISAPSPWWTAVPRSCSTASRMCVIPMMWASDKFPPCVLTGIVPPGHRMLPSATNGPPAPIGAKP